MTILEIALGIALLISGVGNIIQLTTGIKIEVSQQQISQNYNFNINENINANLINSSFFLTNVSFESSVSNGRTNFRMNYNYFSENATARLSKYTAITNQSNFLKIGLYKKKK